MAGTRDGRELILPAANSVEAGLIAYRKAKLAHHLIDVCNALKGGAPLAAAQHIRYPAAAGSRSC